MPENYLQLINFLDTRHKFELINVHCKRRRPILHKTQKIKIRRSMHPLPRIIRNNFVTFHIPKVVLFYKFQISQPLDESYLCIPKDQRTHPP